MFEREITLNRFLRAYLQRLVPDLDDEHYCAAPYPGGNPPVWILGHLAFTTDSGCRIVMTEPVCPAEWGALFAPGTKPETLRPPYPTKEEFVASIENSCEKIAQAIPNVPAKLFDRPHPIELLRETPLKTLGDVLAHLLTSHFSFHLAQLSACRRVAGRPPIV